MPLRNRVFKATALEDSDQEQCSTVGSVLVLTAILCARAHTQAAFSAYRCCVRVTSASKEKNRPRPAPAGLKASFSSLVYLQGSQATQS